MLMIYNLNKPPLANEQKPHLRSFSEANICQKYWNHIDVYKLHLNLLNLVEYALSLNPRIPILRESI